MDKHCDKGGGDIAHCCARRLCGVVAAPTAGGPDRGRDRARRDISPDFGGLWASRLVTVAFATCVPVAVVECTILLVVLRVRSV